MNELLNRQEAEALAEKWLNGTITPEEEQQFFQWYNANIHTNTQLPAGFAADEANLRQRMFTAIQAQKQEAASLLHRMPVPGTDIHAVRTITIQKRVVRWLSAAAVLLLVAGGGRWLMQKPGHAIPATAPPHTAAPAGIILTLASGKQLILDSMGHTNIEEKGAVIRLDEGRLLYSSTTPGTTGNKDSAVTGYNTITTPAGKLFQILLPDGSKVWLNAVSRLSYPVAFTGKNRSVTLSGEAYFEIAPDRQKPFYVQTAEATVHVLGTSFNVMAYTNEPQMRTTLLSGKIRLTPASQSAGNAGAAGANNAPAITLAPGQQATRTATGFEIHDTDAEEAIAWKNGYFQFDRARLPDIMRQLARWYDVEVIYEGQAPGELFSGQIERTASIEQVLKVLALKQVHFTMEGRKIIVHP